MNVGQAIKLCRTRRGISQADLARQAECSVSYLSMLENNKRDPTLSTMTKIAHALRIPVGIIFFLGAEGDDTLVGGLDVVLHGGFLMRQAASSLRGATCQLMWFRQRGGRQTWSEG